MVATLVRALSAQLVLILPTLRLLFSTMLSATPPALMDHTRPARHPAGLATFRAPLVQDPCIQIVKLVKQITPIVQEYVSLFVERASIILEGFAPVAIPTARPACLRLPAISAKLMPR